MKDAGRENDWLFRDCLARNRVMQELHGQFSTMLASEEIITHTGMIVDATFVDAPRQRNNHEENKRKACMG